MQYFGQVVDGVAVDVFVGDILLGQQGVGILGILEGNGKFLAFPAPPEVGLQGFLYRIPLVLFELLQLGCAVRVVQVEVGEEWDDGQFLVVFAQRVKMGAEENVFLGTCPAPGQDAGQ